MGKTHSKPLAARHGMGTAWARHAMCESAFLILIPITTGLQYQYKLPLYSIPNKSRNLLTVLGKHVQRLPFQNAIFNVTLRHGLSVPQRVRRHFLHFSYTFNGSSRSVLIAARFFQPWFYHLISIV